MKTKIKSKLREYTVNKLNMFLDELLSKKGEFSYKSLKFLANKYNVSTMTPYYLKQMGVLINVRPTDSMMMININHGLSRVDILDKYAIYQHSAQSANIKKRHRQTSLSIFPVEKPVVNPNLLRISDLLQKVDDDTLINELARRKYFIWKP